MQGGRDGGDTPNSQTGVGSMKLVDVDSSQDRRTPKRNAYTSGGQGYREKQGLYCQCNKQRTLRERRQYASKKHSMVPFDGAHGTVGQHIHDGTQGHEGAIAALRCCPLTRFN